MPREKPAAGEGEETWNLGKGHSLFKGSPPVPFSSPEGGQDQNLAAATEGNF